MPVPDFQTFMLPLLKFLGALDKETHLSAAFEPVAKSLGLSEEDLSEMLPSGTESRFSNRLSWAAEHLFKAGLLSRPKRGHYAITNRGREILAENPPHINNNFLMRYPEFVVFYRGKKNHDPEEHPKPVGPVPTPLEALESAYDSLKQELADELLDHLKKATPAFFERCVVELLVAMGYGGSRADAGKAIGRSGDGGIDGIIKEDRLGLDVVYVQAKRWDSNPVGRPDVMQFAGALQAQKADKGVFITTSRFTDDAKSYVSQIGSKIVLIDGKQLTEYMIEYNIGVSVVASYPVKKVDSDYFEELY